MNSCELFVFLVLVFLPSLTPQNLTGKIYKLDNVKTIFLGKPNATSSENSINSPWEHEGLDITEHPENFSKSLQEKRLSYETLYSNGSLTLTLVRLNVEKRPTTIHNQTVSENYNTVQKPDNFIEPFLQTDIASIVHERYSVRGLRRLKRWIFGNDTRIRIPPEEIRKVPFSAVVQISTGCTGTLISKNHVLTAAHCVHNGRNYIREASKLKVGLPKHNGKTKWTDVKYIKVPQGWTTDQDYSYDYAVLKLVHHHRRKFLDIGSILQSRGQISIHFLAFHQDKLPDKAMWYSYCAARPLEQSIVSRCDTMPGSSGAGLYVLSGTGRKIKRHVVGVFSGPGVVHFRNGKKRKFNIATKLTPLKTVHICSWARSAPSCDALVR